MQAPPMVAIALSKRFVFRAHFKCRDHGVTQFTGQPGQLLASRCLRSRLSQIPTIQFARPCWRRQFPATSTETRVNPMRSAFCDPHFAKAFIGAAHRPNRVIFDAMAAIFCNIRSWFDLFIQIDCGDAPPPIAFTESRIAMVASSKAKRAPNGVDH